MRRSACVPLPTPGAPTRMMRAARLNSLVAIRKRYADMRSGEAGRLFDGWLRSCSWQREKLEASRIYILQPHFEIVRGMYICTIERCRRAMGETLVELGTEGCGGYFFGDHR